MTTPAHTAGYRGKHGAGSVTSGIYQGGWQGTTQDQGAVGEGVPRAVGVEVGGGSLAGVGPLDILVSGQVAGGQVRVESWSIIIFNEGTL